jgi:hypothetical protein
VKIFISFCSNIHSASDVLIVKQPAYLQTFVLCTVDTEDFGAQIFAGKL